MFCATRGDVGAGVGDGAVVCCLVIIVVVVMVVIVVPAGGAGAVLSAPESEMRFGGVSVRVTVVTVVSSLRAPPGERSKGDPLRPRSTPGTAAAVDDTDGGSAGAGSLLLSGVADDECDACFLPLFERLELGITSPLASLMRCFLLDFRFSPDMPVGESNAREAARAPVGSSR